MQVQCDCSRIGATEPRDAMRVLTCCSAVASVAIFKAPILCSALSIDVAIVVEFFAIVTAIPVDSAVKPPRAVHYKRKTFCH